LAALGCGRYVIPNPAYNSHSRSSDSSIGIFLGFCANVIVKDTGDIAWRLQFGSAFIPSFVLAVGIFFCPESPRWLMKHGKHDKAFQSMLALRAHPIIGARDFYYSYVIYEEELKEARGAGYFARMRDIFAVPRIRRANYGASTVMIAQQMCGINSKFYLLPREPSSDPVQSSLSSVLPSSPMLDMMTRRLCMPHLVMAQCRLCSPFQPYSSLIPRVDEL
jgi:hypothetical protein